MPYVDDSRSRGPYLVRGARRRRAGRARRRPVEHGRDLGPSRRPSRRALSRHPARQPRQRPYQSRARRRRSFDARVRGRCTSSARCARTRSRASGRGFDGRHDRPAVRGHLARAIAVTHHRLLALRRRGGGGCFRRDRAQAGGGGVGRRRGGAPRSRGGGAPRVLHAPSRGARLLPVDQGDLAALGGGDPAAHGSDREVRRVGGDPIDPGADPGHHRRAGHPGAGRELAADRRAHPRGAPGPDRGRRPHLLSGAGRGDGARAGRALRECVSSRIRSA